MKNNESKIKQSSQINNNIDLFIGDSKGYNHVWRIDPNEKYHELELKLATVFVTVFFVALISIAIYCLFNFDQPVPYWVKSVLP